MADFLLEVEGNCLALERELLAGTYRPGAYRTFCVRDPKPRVISAPPFRDRVVHHALCAELEPALERGAAPESFACRRGKGALAALRHARGMARRFHLALKPGGFRQGRGHVLRPAPRFSQGPSTISASSAAGADLTLPGLLRHRQYPPDSLMVD